MSKSHDGKVCIVTGAGSGIGRAAAVEMAAEGAQVVVSDLRLEGTGETVAMIESRGGVACAHQTDVRNEEQVADLIDFAVRTFGRLDCAFNNAGVEGNHLYTPLADYPSSGWSDVIAVNLTGIFFCMKYQLPHLVATKGCIVNASSVTGLTGSRLGSAYHASKHGVIGITRAAAIEYADKGVRINAVAPGVIRTPMAERAFRQNDPSVADRLAAAHPLGRLGEPAEVARAVVWLCSAGASFTTGHVLPVDGGFLVL
jgi:NAD(P)-dependent dehydrogenase (short-subunit alcohol dehydrogenase family)